MTFKEQNSYPEIRVEGINRKYASILLNSYAGEVSEDTAIHLYLYQSLILDEEYNDLKIILKKISEVEMHHLYILGKLVKMLGLKPVYATFDANNVNYWSGKNVKYFHDLESILKINIRSEEEAIKQYEKSIYLINDKYVKNILRRIIDDEKIHLNIFRSYYQKNIGNKY